MPGHANVLVVSDIDGTLLDHETYDYNDAKPALGHLRKTGVPLVLASSKTAAEIAPLRAELGFDHCEAIVENGAGILEPGEANSADTSRYEAILAVLAGLPSGLRDGFTGFSRWSPEEISAKTGLSPENARRAGMRQFSEPGIWSGTQDAWLQVLSHLQAHGLTAHKGGRFVTVSFGHDKASRMHEIKARYRKAGNDPLVIAFGDAPNDIALLEAADIGVIIPNPAHDGLAVLEGESTGKIRRASHPAPLGWNEAIFEVLT
ncbi:MAG: HAD-IIB family hydrolase [Pseudomonadota bacterium]